MLEQINFFPDFAGSFGYKLIEKRATGALRKLVVGRSSSIRQVSESQFQQKAFYWLLDNEKFSQQNIERVITERCGELCKGRQVLGFQDIIEMNLEPHRGRIKADSGIGKTTKEGINVFFCTPVLWWMQIMVQPLVTPILICCIGNKPDMIATNGLIKSS